MVDDNDSRVAENILLFCRTLRKAGLRLGPGQVIEAMTAVVTTGIKRRDDFYYALRATLLTNSSQFRLFDQAFHIYFRNPRLLERMMSMLLPTLERESAPAEQGETVRRLMEAMAESKEHPSDEVVIEIDRSASASRRELLRSKDFDQMSLEEAAQAKQLLRLDLGILRQKPTRRYRNNNSGGRYDLRKSMQLMLRNNGQIIELARKTRRRKPPTLVLICDISGSMSAYSRMFLQFAHAISMWQRSVHGFVFGTRLTNITRWLHNRDADAALERISTEVKDWDGGTRIADCIERFNIDWARRVLGRDSVVVLLSDGLERDSMANLDFQMRRLHHCCNQLVWMNPMLRYSEFEAKAMGIRTMLGHVDEFVPAHNIDSLVALGQLLQSGRCATEKVA